MDFATFFGLGAGLIMIAVAVVFGGGPAYFLHWPSLLIMLGGTLSAMMIHFPAKQIRNAFAVARNCFVSTLPETTVLIERFRQLALTARRGGLRSLEKSAEEESDPFMRLGLELTSSSCDPKELVATFARERKALDQRHLSGRRMFEVLGTAAPAWGMVGTLIGLVQMLRHLEDPRQIGSGLAIALLTTLYGALFSNLLCIPLAGKLETRHAEEEAVRDVMAEGFMSLLEEHSPTVIEGRLRSWVPPVERVDSPNRRANAS